MSDEYVDPNVIPEPPRPPDDADFTWHVHDDGGWAEGVVCAECRAPMRLPVPGPSFNIRHLQRQNLDGTTTRSEEREALGDRWDDEKIGRA